jgi:hypothetical protein
MHRSLTLILFGPLIPKRPNITVIGLATVFIVVFLSLCVPLAIRLLPIGSVGENLLGKSIPVYPIRKSLASEQDERKRR